MNNNNFDLVVASRLEDMASQVEKLYASGMIEEAQLLRQEGLELAEAANTGTTFLYINDLTEA